MNALIRHINVPVARQMLSQLSNRGEQLAIGDLKIPDGISLREAFRRDHEAAMIIANYWMAQLQE
jgi:hypothetical protein